MIFFLPEVCGDVWRKQKELKEIEVISERYFSSWIKLLIVLASGSSAWRG